MIRRLVALVAGAALVQACAPKPPSSSTTAQPAVVTPADSAACPDSTETPEIIAAAIKAAGQTLRSSGSVSLRTCYVAVVANNVKSYDDSTVTLAADMSRVMLGRNPNDRLVLQAQLSLLPAAGAPDSVAAKFDRLVSLDPAAATLTNYRRAIAGAYLARDNAARLRLLTAAARKFPSAGSIVADYNIQRQIPRLRALIDSSHQVLRLDPRRIERYATLASVFGNLDVPDSAMHYTRRALQAGVPRNEVAPSLQSLIGVVMRKAQLLDRAETWEATLPLARSIDRTLSTDASKHLIGLSAIYVAAEYVRDARHTIGTSAQAAGGTAPRPTGAAKAEACRRLALVPTLLTEARTAMNQGGSRFSSESVPAIQTAAAVVAREHGELSPRCAG